MSPLYNFAAKQFFVSGQCHYRVSTAHGKTGKLPKEYLSGKIQGICTQKKQTGKIHGILYPQNLMIKDISIFAAKYSLFFLETRYDCKSLKLQWESLCSREKAENMGFEIKM